MNFETLLQAERVSKYFPVKSGAWAKIKNHVRAVDGIDLKILPGETLGLVGESGSGKSTLGRVLIGLLDTSHGNVLFKGKNIKQIKDTRPLRRQMQIVFQDPYGSLNPKISIGSAIGESLEIHGVVLQRMIILVWTT